MCACYTIYYFQLFGSIIIFWSLSLWMNSCGTACINRKSKTLVDCPKPQGHLGIALLSLRISKELFLAWSLSHCRSHDPRCPMKTLMTRSAFPSRTGYVCQKGMTARRDVLNIAKPGRCRGCFVVSLASSFNKTNIKHIVPCLVPHP